MTKQQKDQKQLKKNLVWILKNFSKFEEKFSRLNYLMAIGVSCQPKTMTFYYGHDPINKEVVRLGKTLLEEDEEERKTK